MQDIMQSFWKRLKAVKQLSLETRSKNGSEWRGKAEVLVTLESDTVLTFEEHGFWEREPEVAFHNIFRWTLDEKAGGISLEHLRLGHPVFLLYLVPDGNHRLISKAPHVCKADVYSAQISWDHQCIHLSWRITGPKKDEEMEYEYT